MACVRAAIPAPGTKRPRHPGRKQNTEQTLEHIKHKYNDRLSRALENQLERSLAWRCSQPLAQKGVRDRGRDSTVPGGSPDGVDYGAARLCRGLLEQCDLCADAARALCTAVSPGSVGTYVVDCGIIHQQ